MVATSLTVQDISILTAGGTDVPDTNGLEPAMTSAPAAGDYRFTNTGHEFILIEKSSGSSEFIVTVDSVAADNYGYDHDTIAHITDAGVLKQRLLGPFDPYRFNNTVDSIANQVKFTTSGSNTGVSIAVIRLPAPPRGL